MNQFQFRFQPEKLVVHYITLNLKEIIDKKELRPIAKYLCDHCNFNSTLYTDELQESFYYKPSNKNHVEFRVNYYNPKLESFWKGTQLHFKGYNAIPLYELIRTQKFEWDIFNLEKLNVGRFDIHYFFPEDWRSRKELVHNFFGKSKSNALSQGAHAEIDKDGVLKIGKRNSPNHLRVYMKEKEIPESVYYRTVYGLEFELEMKAFSIKKFQNLLFSKNLPNIQTFENNISHHYYKYCLKWLDLTTSCTSWLVDTYRKKIRLNSSEQVLAIDYFSESSLNTFSEKDSLFKLFQLLSFIRVEQIQPDKTETLLGQTYFSLSFPLHKFIKFIGMDAPGGTGHARRIKVKQSLLSLAHVKPLVNHFSLNEFESYPIIGPLKVLKEGRFLIVRMSILRQIYDYRYPFLLPRSFLLNETRYELYIKIEILRVVAVKDRKKKFHLENFLNEFSVSNRKKKQMKLLLINSLDDLKDFFEPTFSIKNKNGNIIETKKLTLTLISKAKIIYFTEAIKKIKN